MPPHAAQPNPPVPRTALLTHLADRIAEIGAARVGVDGVDGAGKTVFADALADVLRATGREAVRVSLDGFHQPRAVRYRRGRSSPEGFWLDSYDYARFRADVLEPFAPGGSRTYRSAIRDVASDQPVDVKPVRAGPGAVLVVDGIFLHRDELVDCWEFSVFLDVTFDVSFARMARRDGMPADPTAPPNRRYAEGQRRYLADCRPWTRASVVIDNTDFGAPRLVTADQSGSAGTAS